MGRYLTGKVGKIPITHDHITAMLHRDAMIIVEVTRVPWQSGDLDDRLDQLFDFLTTEDEKENTPIPFDESWWPLPKERL